MAGQPTQRPIGQGRSPRGLRPASCALDPSAKISRRGRLSRPQLRQNYVGRPAKISRQIGHPENRAYAAATPARSNQCPAPLVFPPLVSYIKWKCRDGRSVAETLARRHPSPPSPFFRIFSIAPRRSRPHRNSRQWAVARLRFGHVSAPVPRGGRGPSFPLVDRIPTR